jgi:hypothetical protein
MGKRKAETGKSGNWGKAETGEKRKLWEATLPLAISKATGSRFRFCFRFPLFPVPFLGSHCADGF